MFLLYALIEQTCFNHLQDYINKILTPSAKRQKLAVEKSVEERQKVRKERPADKIAEELRKSREERANQHKEDWEQKERFLQILINKK